MRCAGMTWHRQTGMKRVCPNWHDMASKYVHSDACVQAVNNDVRIQSLVCVCVCVKNMVTPTTETTLQTHTHTQNRKQTNKREHNTTTKSSAKPLTHKQTSATPNTHH